jgi:hypothetical protein
VVYRKLLRDAGGASGNGDAGADGDDPHVIPAERLASRREDRQGAIAGGR